jgi:hypothetical protein
VILLAARRHSETRVFLGEAALGKSWRGVPRCQFSTTAKRPCCHSETCVFLGEAALGFDPDGAGAVGDFRPTPRSPLQLLIQMI